MNQNQQYYRPQRPGRQDSEGANAHDEPLTPKTPGGGLSGSSKAKANAASQGAKSTLGNIDAALNNFAGGAKGGQGGKDGGGNLTGNKAADKALKTAAPEAAGIVEGINKLKNIVGGTKQRKRTSMVTTVVAVMAIASFLGFVAILPDELISFMETLEQHFFAKIEYDLDKEGQKLVSKYVQQRILRRLGVDCEDSSELSKCASDKDRSDGNDKTPEEDPIEGKGGVFDAMDGADFSDELGKRGITFTASGGKYFMEADGLPGGKLDITKFATTDGENLFDLPELAEGGVGDTLKKALAEILPEDGSFFHFLFTKEINAIDGDKFCVEDCAPDDQTNTNEQAAAKVDDLDKVDEAVDNSAQKAAGTVIADAESCLTDVTCDPTDRMAPTENATDNALAGEDESTWDQTVRTDLQSVAPEDISTLATNETSDETFTADGEQATADAAESVLSDGAVADVTTEAGAGIAEKFSIIGWVQMAAQLIQFIATAGTKMAAFFYKVHQAWALRQFAPAAAAAAEMMSGKNHANVHEVDALSHALERGGKNAAGSPYVLQQTDPEHHPGDDPKTVHDDLVKKHEAFNGSNGVISQASEIANKIPGFGWLADLASLIDKIFSWALGPLNFLISKLFGVTGIDKLIALAIGPLLQLAANWLFPLPNVAHPDGETHGTAIAEGASSSASLAGDNIGGKKLTAVESNNLVTYQENSDYQQFKQMSLYARMFDINTPYSLVSKMALDLPSTTAGGLIRSTAATLLKNPVRVITDSLAIVLHPPQAFAAPPPADDPSGIISTGLPVNDPVFTADPEDYWNSHDCANQAAQGYPVWNADVTLDPDTGQTVHNSTNGCLLISRSVQSLGTMAGFSQ